MSDQLQTTEAPTTEAPATEAPAHGVALTDVAAGKVQSLLAQEGGFYGGWITARVVGPFKGVPGSWGW